MATDDALGRDGRRSVGWCGRGVEVQLIEGRGAFPARRFLGPPVSRAPGPDRASRNSPTVKQVSSDSWTIALETEHVTQPCCFVHLQGHAPCHRQVSGPPLLFAVAPASYLNPCCSRVVGKTKHHRRPSKAFLETQVQLLFISVPLLEVFVESLKKWRHLGRSTAESQATCRPENHSQDLHDRRNVFVHCLRVRLSEQRPVAPRMKQTARLGWILVPRSIQLSPGVPFPHHRRHAGWRHGHPHCRRTKWLILTGLDVSWPRRRYPHLGSRSDFAWKKERP